MALCIRFIPLAILLTTIQAGHSDKGPHMFVSTTTPTPLKQQYKEVVLYLTPTQIRALENGQATIEAHPTSSTDVLTEDEKNKMSNALQENGPQPVDEFEKEAKKLSQAQSNQRPTKGINVPPVEEPNQEMISEVHQQILPTYQQQEKFNAPPLWNPQLDQQSYSYFRFSNNGQSQNNINLQLFYPHLQEDIQNAVKQNIAVRNKYQLIPYEYKSEDGNSQHSEEFNLQDKLQNQIKQNSVQLSAFLPNDQQEDKKQESLYAVKDTEKTEKVNLFEPYAPQFSIWKHQADLENLKLRNQIEKHKALARAEAIAKSPPVIVHKVTVTKHHHIPVIKHVKVPVPTPVLVPVPKPFEVRIPQPYPVPLEIVQPIVLHKVRSENVEKTEQEVEKRMPDTKNIYYNIDKPYYIQNFVPVEIKKEISEIPALKPEKLTILRHIWGH